MLASNHWDCPISVYSNVVPNDYNTTKGQCGIELKKEKKFFLNQRRKISQ